MADDQVDILETVPDVRDVAQPHGRAVAAAKHHDLLEFLLNVTLAKGANPYLPVRGVDAAGG